MNYEMEEIRSKTIRFPVRLIEKIEEMAKQNQRDFSKQIRFMCEEYLKMKETR